MLATHTSLEALERVARAVVTAHERDHGTFGRRGGRAIAAPRTPMSRAPSSRLKSPEATSAENSPRL
jgi:predicted RNA-binding protein YlqC (UPF0109 family)